MEIPVRLIAPPETPPAPEDRADGRPAFGRRHGRQSLAGSGRAASARRATGRAWSSSRSSAAATAMRLGLKPGDIILAVNGQHGGHGRAICRTRSPTPMAAGTISLPQRRRNPHAAYRIGEGPAALTGLFESQAPRPLADRLRPTRLDEVVGQEHLLAADAPIGRMVAARPALLDDPLGAAGLRQDHDRPPAGRAHRRCISSRSRRCSPASPICARSSRRPRARRAAGQGTLLFVDEIHRFNRAQQDGFLPYVEDGTVILVGATTENPSFELNGALLSRCQVFVLNRLDDAALEQLLAPRRGGARAGRCRSTPRRAGRCAPWPTATAAISSTWSRSCCALPPGRSPRHRRPGGGGAAPRAALRQGAGRPLQPHQRAAQIAARLRHRCGALLAGAHAGRRRGPALHRPAPDPLRGRGYRPRRPPRPAAGDRRLGRL